MPAVCSTCHYRLAWSHEHGVWFHVTQPPGAFHRAETTAPIPRRPMPDLIDSMKEA